MAATYRIKMQGSDAPAEEVDQKTIDFLKEKRLLGGYDVQELKAVDKPAELTAKTKPAATGTNA